MKDFLGNELSVNDEVVYIDKDGCGSVNLRLGKISEIKRGLIYIDPKYDDHYISEEGILFRNRVRSVSVMKLNKT